MLWNNRLETASKADTTEEERRLLWINRRDRFHRDGKLRNIHTKLKLQCDSVVTRMGKFDCLIYGKTAQKCA